jgi:secreted protein with Ig-like and vWFA domain
MKTIYEDPRLTAYVLGEMNQRDQAKFEKEITASPELARAVEEMKESASLFGEALTLEAGDLGLSMAQRETIQRAMKGEKKPARRWGWMPQPYSSGWNWVGACGVLLLAGFLWILNSQHVVFEGRIPRNEFVVLHEDERQNGKSTGLVDDKDKNASGTLLTDALETERKKNVPPPLYYKAEVSIGEGSEVLMSLAPEVQTAPPAASTASGSGSANAPEAPVPSAKPATRAPTDIVVGQEQSLRRGDAPGDSEGKERLETAKAGAKLNGYIDSGYIYNFSGGSSVIEGRTVTDENKKGDFNLNAVKLTIEKPLVTPSEFQAGFRADVRTGEGPGNQLNTGIVDTRPSKAQSKSDRDVESRYAYGLKDPRAEAGNEAYEALRDNPFKRVLDVETGTSTFGADVDTASYSNVRRFLQDGQLPPKEAVRIEELLNYFSYNYPQGEGREPFATSVEIASAPWAPKHRLVRVGIRAKDVAAKERQPMNLVFLVDVSGSMSSENKLPLVQKSLRLLTRKLERRDRVAIVVYAGSSGLVLDSTSDKRRILDAIDRMKSGGSTNGAGGIRQAYQVARDHFIENGINRVILCTDGDFNVGTTDRDELVAMIEQKRQEGVFLNIYGFGMGNLKDATLEQLANKGNGTYGYIDSFAEAQKVFSQQLSGTLVTVAKDVKFQVEFNPSQVAAWRQIGYENRQLAREDFNDDTKDAGEVGAGHTVTVLYEVVPAGVEPPVGPDAHRYLEENPKSQMTNPKGGSKEMLFLKIRYKEPKEDESKLLSFPVKDAGVSWQKASGDFQFAASVAAFGMLLRESPYRGGSTWSQVEALARYGKGEDEHGHRAEYLRLVELARDLSKRD